MYSLLLSNRSIWPFNFVNGHLAINYAELILDIHTSSYLLNAARIGALSLHRSWNVLFFHSHCVSAGFMFPTWSSCWSSLNLSLRDLSQVNSPSLSLQEFPTFSAHKCSLSLIRFISRNCVTWDTVSWGERWCFAIVFKMRPHDSCNNEAEAQSKDYFFLLRNYKYRNTDILQHKVAH